MLNSYCVFDCNSWIKSVDHFSLQHQSILFKQKLIRLSHTSDHRGKHFQNHAQVKQMYKKSHNFRDIKFQFIRSELLCTKYTSTKSLICI